MAQSRTRPAGSNFSPAGYVTWAQFFPGEPGHIKPTRAKGARAEGIRYEKKAQEYIKRKCEGVAEIELIQSPWLIFRSGQNPKDRYCQPDALLINMERKHITIVEIKLQHTHVAWWQIRQLYEPVLRCIYPGFTFAALEVVRWLDPRVDFPEKYFYAEDILTIDPGRFGVHIYDPRVNK